MTTAQMFAATLAAGHAPHWRARPGLASWRRWRADFVANVNAVKDGVPA